jgi:hypothetical protein
VYRIGIREEFKRLARESFARQVSESTLSSAALPEDSRGPLAFGLELRDDLGDDLLRDPVLAEVRADQPVASVSRGEASRPLGGEPVIGEQPRLLQAVEGRLAFIGRKPSLLQPAIELTA